MAPLLTESISDIDDLDIKTFISVLRRLPSMQATEKLDGQSLWVGVNESGNLFTSRASKNAQRFTSADDYPYYASNNGPRSAHGALARKVRDITSILRSGEIVEIEVLYGRQPNAVTYGLDNKNFISFRRGVEGTNDLKAEQLAGALENQEVSVKSIVVETTDGINLDRRLISQSFRFIGTQPVKNDLLKDVKLSKELNNLEKYLDKESGINGLTNGELMSASLGSIDKETRPAAKEAKDKIISTVKSQHKAVIKRALIDGLVSKVKPSLSATDLAGDEDVGVEGIVLKDPETGELVKITDKQSFATINQFNYAVRNQLVGLVRTTDDAAPLEARGGIVGQMKIRIADLLGHKDLALSREANQLFTNNKGETPTETLRNVAAILHGKDDYNGVKRKISAVISATLDEVASMLDKFNKYRNDAESTYRLKMPNGKAIGLSNEVIKRTLVTFAETRRNLTELKEKIDDTKSFDQLVAALYGKTARGVHSETSEDSALSESLELFERRNFVDTARFEEIMQPEMLIHAYVATLLMSVVILKVGDRRGRQLLKDKKHARLTKLTAEMSPLNFWGYGLWKLPTSLRKEVVAGVRPLVKKVPAFWIKMLHIDLSYDGDVPVDWHDHKKTIVFLLQHASKMVIDRVMNLVDDVFAYSEASYDDKVKLLPRLFFYAQQYVPTSPLIIRVKHIQHELLSGKETPLTMTPGQRLLGEDGEIAVDVSGNSAGYQATTSVNIAPTEIKLGRNNRIVPRKRNPKALKPKFERPKD